jgi:hypothetical protein
VKCYFPQSWKTTNGNTICSVIGLQTTEVLKLMKLLLKKLVLLERRR